MSGRTRLIASATVAFAGALIAALLIFGGDGSSPGPTVAQPVATGTTKSSEKTSAPTSAPPGKQPPVKQTEAKAAGPKQGHQAQQEGPSGPAPTTDPEKQASSAVDDFVSALDSHDGRRICAAFAAGALDGVKFPEQGSDCASTVEASLGYRDPRGLPVWHDSKPTGDISARIDGDDARVTATILTTYADQRDPSVEDDVLYLRRVGSRWLLLKPSSTFYRAIGVADVPLDAFKPPG